jgi:hypothetical protein
MLKNIFGLVNNTLSTKPKPNPNTNPKPTPATPLKPDQEQEQKKTIYNKEPEISPEIVSKMNIFYKLLEAVCIMLDDNKISFYLDCGTLLGCIREGRLLLHDTDVDVTIHLSKWEKLIDIDYSKYGLVLKRKYKGFPDYSGGNLISVYLENESPNYYCDIYANPAFPMLIAAQMGDNLYPVPKDPGLYLKQLYGNWMVPSSANADTDYHRNNGLIFSEYRKNWDLKYNIYKCKF